MIKENSQSPWISTYTFIPSTHNMHVHYIVYTNTLRNNNFPCRYTAEMEFKSSRSLLLENRVQQLVERVDLGHQLDVETGKRS